MAPGQIRDETLKQLRQAKSKMLSLEFQLNLEKEPPEVRREAAISLSNTEVAILKLRTSELAAIREALIENEEALNKGAEGLRKALANLKKVAEILAAASTFLGVIGRIVKLL